MCKMIILLLSDSAKSWGRGGCIARDEGLFEEKLENCIRKDDKKSGKFGQL